MLNEEEIEAAQHELGVATGLAGGPPMTPGREQKRGQPFGGWAERDCKIAARPQR